MLSLCRVDKVTEQEIVDFIAGLGGVDVVTASPENGAPEVAWGDLFFSIPGNQQPFATVVKGDYPGVDESSQLDRDGVFRVNVGIGREALRALFQGDDEDHDPSAFDVFFPHPVYAAHGWVSVLNPDTLAGELRELLRAAHARAAGK